jgi:aerobic-type carbon monoxide dehydrogenase small subunit (CoxS/CutS family)
MSTQITLTINGETVETQADVTLGSVLHQRQGSWRSSPLRHAPRGIYCGMGVCFECAVSVDGVAVRACITQVRPGMRVEALP